MFRRILVPLDGSRLSEASLHPTLVFAEHFGSAVILLHLIEKDAPAEIHHERHLTTADEAQVYLHEVALRAFPPGIRVDTHVHEVSVPDVGPAIVEHAAKEVMADLIVTCTHGRGGVRDMLFGSIAQRVVAQGRLPLLLIKPELPGFRVKKVLVPLDADSMHDPALELAAVLATAFSASLHLLSVIPTVGTLAGAEAATSSLMPVTTKALLELREEQAVDHLQHHIRTLEEQGLVAFATVARGDPAGQILQFGESEGMDLILLSTHRKTGLEAFWSKSVAPRVAQQTRKAVLLQPI